ncbi:4Fe-4S binding protein [Bacillus sp. 166amftsu]|uniref:indolepyruvate ferredoxin oxidoreductase subunit alpha n=1 Tax=Bacillus sp. 166amftsu TaxID=1761753 RepID=UPI000896AEC0|nr:4Fe-4S binding protein [Bacillus sp. 166amftsu]SDY77301.1 4Fe-4S binding domain-containing protein [Bacillus sp. 166amftsu]
MAFVITSPCISEKAADCIDVCPADCIELGSDQYFINPALCIDCGACETACPVEAIYHEDELLDEDLNFLEKAKKYFSV